MIDDHDYRIRDLDSRTDALDSDLKEVQRKLGYVDDVEGDLRRVRSDISDVDDRVDELRDSLTDLERDSERAVDKLVLRVQHLEAQLAAADDAIPRADFDTFPASWTKLGELAGRAREARAVLLSEGARGLRHSHINSYRKAVARRDAMYGNVIAAAHTLATTPFGDAKHTEAAQTFNSARHQAEQCAKQANAYAADAREAQAALDEDRETRHRDAKLLAEGARAQEKLNLHLRTRISEAVSARALLPVWFTTALGPTAPTSKTEDWLETATDVLAYRTTYKVTDQVLALGAEPEDHAPGRARWHTAITNALRRF
ncbi:hypothetical protein ACTWJ8_40515 (plasmid) [Streptomyces sp. SDT5-1]|uniref:hypothetical protein n=1 Tax=Streptomyces sp. SDT5-1 TaxID=3406418 RepID=UPI003FD12F7E